MNVVEINTYYQYGSTGMIVGDLETAMMESGISPYILYGRDMYPPEASDHVYKINTSAGYLAHKWTTHLLGYQCLSSTGQTKKAIDILRHIRPDVVHLHNLHGHYLNIKILFDYLRETQVPVVWTFHDCWPFTGHCAYFFNIGCDKWKTGCGNCPQKIAYPRSLFFDRSAEQWKIKQELYGSLPNLHIVTVSHWLESLVRESFLSASDIRTIYNGVDTAIFYPRITHDDVRKKLDAGEKKIVLGVASGWTERKGLSDFLYLAQKLPKDAEIVLVGKVPSGFRLPENILPYGCISDKNELASLYSAADVFVNPSRQETFGLTTAEAMACGTPAVVYNVTACPEVVGDDLRCGDKVTPFDKQELYEKTVQILQQPTAGGKFPHEQVANMFDKGKQIGEYISLYNELYR